MAHVERFEDLIAWQKARLLAAEIYRATRVPPFSRDFGLATQIQRAASSVMSNIAEGFDRGSRAEFHPFLSVAKGSCAEVRSQLYLAHDIGYVGEAELRRLLALNDEVSRLVAALRKVVASQRDQQRAEASRPPRRRGANPASGEGD